MQVTHAQHEDTLSPGVPQLVRYLAELSAARLVLWCYLVWYLGVAIPYFDPSPQLWINSLGISVVVGTALYLSVAHAGTSPTRLDFWQVARLYIMPLCVSSFSALIKDRGFVLIFHPTVKANLVMLAACGAVVASSRLARQLVLARLRPAAGAAERA